MFENLKLNRLIKKSFTKCRVIVEMRDGTTKNISGKKLLKMDSRLIKHFCIADGNE